MKTVEVKLRGGRMDGVVTTAEKQYALYQIAPALAFHEQHEGKERIASWYWLIQSMPGEWIGVYDPYETAKRRK